MLANRSTPDKVWTAAQVHGWALTSTDYFREELGAYHFHRPAQAGSTGPKYMHVYFNTRGSVTAANTESQHFDGPGKLARVLDTLAGYDVP